MRSTVILLFLQLWGNVKVSLSQNDCSQLPDIPHAHVSDNTKKDEYQQGNVIRFTCETGYISGPPIRYVCSEGGWIAVHEGTCYLKPCELPDDTPNGYYEIIKGEDFVFGTTIKYFCNRGYQMVSKDDTRTCLLDRWTNHVPICGPVSCEHPSADGRITVKGFNENEELILPDRFLTFSCDDPRTYLNGSSVLICGHEGEWDHPFPTCEDITCTVGETDPRLTVTGPIIANKTVNVGHNLRFQCDDQYSLEGPEVIECLQNGQWNKAFPTCTDRCKFTVLPPGIRITPPRPPNNQVRQGQKINFECPSNRHGHVLRGNKTVECLAGGQWSDQFPTCGPPEGCGRPPPLANGDTKNSAHSKYRHNEWVEYGCQSSYTMNGRPYKTCNNGEWTGQMKCLRPCTVTREIMNRYNIHFSYSNDEKLYARHDEGLTFSCNYGRQRVSLLGMRQVCNDGVMQLPSCQ
ncbi:complement factor H-like [Labrus mixtus]|uniref:complement factor H-like n=1 Tax=Labrus mixtus TaxID=508554 RepID=UPI0029C07D42|nr:complement factor H-like [Labrus mixtus]